MLKRKYAIFMSSLVVTGLLFSGCGSQTQQTSDNTQNPAVSASADPRNPNSGNQNNGNNQDKKRQMPDVMGEITSVTGNQIALKLIEAPQWGQRTDKGGKPEFKPEPGQQQSPNNKDGATGDAKQPGQPKQPAPIKYTGENTTITVPEGMSITTTTRNGDRNKDGNKGEKGEKPETITVDIKNIKAGDIIQVWYSDKQSKTISKITVRQNRNNGAPNTAQQPESKEGNTDKK